MFKIDTAIHITKDRINFILLYATEIFTNKLPLPLSVLLVIKTRLIFVIKIKIR